MTKRIVLPVLIAPALVLALAGCVPVFGPVALGPRVTDDRDIESVESVLVRTDGNLSVSVGDTPSLEITAPQNVLDRLTSEIVDGVLVLDIKGPHFGPLYSDGYGITYELTVPRLSELAIEGSSDVQADFSGADDVRIIIDGSGDVTGTGVEADRVTSSIAGSGDIDLTGTADEQSLEIDGSGDFGGQDLISRDATVEIAGSGDVEVHATGTLRADISGSGEIRYTGGATVSSEVSGSGSVIED
jgi:hypothetical protein